MTAVVVAVQSALAGVLAHQGGWDETLLVLGPMVVFAGLLAVARRRVEQEEQEEGGADGPPAGDEGGPDR